MKPVDASPSGCAPALPAAVAVALDDEAQAGFDTLRQGLLHDFGPQGTVELWWVERMAHLLWQQQRLRRLEQLQLALAERLPVTPQAVFQKMQLTEVPPGVYELFGLLDAPEPLTADDLQEAEEMLVDCDDFERMPGLLLDPARGPTAFPRLWRRVIPQDWQSDPEAMDWLSLNASACEPTASQPEMLQKVRTAVARTREHFAAIAFLLRQRAAIERAQAAVRADQLMAAWNPDQSDRHHTQLHTQFNHALATLCQLQQRRRAAPPAPTDAPAG